MISRPKPVVEAPTLYKHTLFCDYFQTGVTVKHGGKEKGKKQGFRDSGISGFENKEMWLHKAATAGRVGAASSRHFMEI
jgi:hypothetical protein